MNPPDPTLADVFTRGLRNQAQAAGPVPAFQADELALWQADRKAYGCFEAPAPRTLRVGPFTYWLGDAPRLEPCP